MRGVLALMASAALLLGSCSEDDSHAYLEAVADTNERMESQTFAALPRGAEPTREAITAVVGLREAAVAELRALDPPESLEIEHEAYTTSLRVLVEESRRFLDTTADLDDAAFLAALGESADLEILAGAVARACSALQSAATAERHDTDVRC
jgi:hypothetical protein